PSPGPHPAPVRAPGPHEVRPAAARPPTETPSGLHLLAADLVEIDEHMPRAPEYLADPVRRGGLHPPWVGRPAQASLERGVDLQAGQRPTEADVNAASPTHMLVVLTFRVEGIGVSEAPWVAVGRAVHQEDRRALGDGRARDLDIGQRRAAGEELHRGL